MPKPQLWTLFSLFVHREKYFVFEAVGHEHEWSWFETIRCAFRSGKMITNPLKLGPDRLQDFEAVGNSRTSISMLKISIWERRLYGVMMVGKACGLIGH